MTLKRMILVALVATAAFAGTIYIPAVGDDIHRHTAHQCHKIPDQEHVCSHAAHARAVAAIDPAPDCYPCSDFTGCICPTDCVGLGIMFRLRNLGNIHIAHLLFGEPR